MKYTEKLAALRKQMNINGIDAYLIPSADPHISEYLPDKYKVIAWLSGFRGSAGTLLITQDFAGLWTDSRYFVQATEQLAGTGFELVKLQVQHAPEYADWVIKNLPEKAVFAFDGKLTSAQLAITLKNKLRYSGIEIRGNADLIENIWADRPVLPSGKAFLLSSDQTGQTTISKLAAVRDAMKDNYANTHIISTLDDLAWTLNIRGNDVKCNPVVLGFLLITPSKNQLFIDENKLNAEQVSELKAAGVSISAYENVWENVQNLDTETSLLVDSKKTCYQLYEQIPSHVTIIEATNPSTKLKAIKNATEMQLTRETMVKDGVALTRFFKWMEENIEHIEMNEISIAEKLFQFRSEQDGFVGESFDTISAFKAHAALPHYKATSTSNSKIDRTGLLLVDSGGQYLSGTTDITRVVTYGTATSAEKKDYTLVLRGMIDGVTSIYPKGTRGYQIDAITRKPLWDEHRNYGHGTGHGVGFFLNVHEGPQVFNTTAVDIPIEAGMITSIEPGLYREGEYGIRIENLVNSCEIEKNQFGQFMNFETLTLCYISTDLIDKDLLETKHLNWLNTYHELVFEQLSPELDAADKAWLYEKTKAI